MKKTLGICSIVDRVNMSLRSVAVVVAAVAMTVFFAMAPALDAQGGPPGSRGRGQGQGPDRAAIEAEFEQRIERLVRDQLKLSEDQIKQVRAVSSKAKNRRADLMKRAGETQRSLRAEVAKDAGADQKKVKKLMDEEMAGRKRFFELLEDERKELAEFLTPVQVAKYQQIQQQLMQQVHQRAGEGRHEGGERGKGGKGREKK